VRVVHTELFTEFNCLRNASSSFINKALPPPRTNGGVNLADLEFDDLLNRMKNELAIKDPRFQSYVLLLREKD
jgi:hypothetical protein